MGLSPPDALPCGMDAPDARDFDRVLFDSELIRIGAFRCHPSHPSFHDSGPARNFCFVFPRTAVEIQHEHQRPFVANPNIVTFYNLGQPYQRNPVSADGDRCDWFGVHADLVRDIVRSFDPAVDDRPEAPFRFTHRWSDAGTYLLQRRVFERVANGALQESLAVEELVIRLLESVLRSAPVSPPSIGIKQRDVLHHVKLILSQRLGERLTLRNVAREAELSPYHLCRLFRRATEMTLHQYRQKLLLRWSLESVAKPEKPLVDIALDAGFSSHSHYTSAFHREFAESPSKVRKAII